MKNFLRVLVVVSVACLGVDAQDKKPADNKPVAKPSPTEIEALIKNLGSPSFATREKATKRLRDTPSALHQLRQSLKGHDVETTSRMIAVIDELARKRFHLRLTELAKEKSDAPLDLLTELLLENRKYVGDGQWKQSVDIVFAINDKILKEKKLSAKSAEVMSWFDIAKCRDLVGRVISLDNAGGRRIIADRVELERGSTASMIVAYGLESGVHADSVLLINGTVKLGGTYSNCFVYCDGDFTHTSGSSTIIARGRVVRSAKYNYVLHKFAIENARTASSVKLFSMERVGIKVGEKGTQLEIEKVLGGSRAEKCGFKLGDIIQIEKKTGDSVGDLERLVRQAYVKETDLEMRIVRDGRQQRIVLSFVD